MTSLNTAPTPPAANQVLQIWLKDRDQALTLNLEGKYAVRLAEAMSDGEAAREGDTFLILRHRQASASVIRRADVQAVRAMNAIAPLPGLPAPQETDVWISLKGTDQPLILTMAEEDAWELCDLFHTLELGPSEDHNFQLHGKSGDLLTLRGCEIVWVRVADSLLREGRRQVALQDGLPPDDE